MSSEEIDSYNDSDNDIEDISAHQSYSSKLGIDDKISTSNYFLKLLNDENSCYCNSIVQALLSLNNKCFSRVSKLILTFYFSL